MKYCCHCAGELSASVQPGDTHTRMLCQRCGPQVMESIQQFYTDHQRDNYSVYSASYFDEKHVLRRIPTLAKQNVLPSCIKVDN
jgi:hypothetical protein